MASARNSTITGLNATAASEAIEADHIKRICGA
jgi:hypothetical protein